VRAKHGGVNYRMLYFFHGRTAAVLSHGITKQKIAFEADPQRHTFTPSED
jgi:hypothetical protein